jgi:hypothetical protein
VLCVPLVASVPLHPPEALQDVAYVEVQVSVTESPASIVVVDAFIDTIGNGAEADPPPQAANNKKAANIHSREINRMTYQVVFFSMSSFSYGTCGESAYITSL